MAFAQAFIDALRLGKYDRALDLALCVTDIYDPILNKGTDKQIAHDELMQLMIYELAQTDINENDLESLNFLSNYLGSQTSLSGSATGFACVSFFTAGIPAIAIKQSKAFDQVMENTELSTKESIKNFLTEKSPFSKLVADSNDNMQAISKAHDKGLDDRAMYSHLCKMDKRMVVNFKQSLQKWGKPIDNSDEAPPPIQYELIDLRNKNYLQNLNNLIQQYKRELTDELKQDGYTFKDGRFVSDIPRVDMPIRVTKLLLKFEAWNEINIKPNEIPSQMELNKVYNAINVCKNNEPNWLEQRLLQVIANIVTIGIFSYLRNRKERDLANGLMHAANNTPSDIDFELQQPQELQEIQKSVETENSSEPLDSVKQLESSEPQTLDELPESEEIIEPEDMQKPGGAPTFG